MTEQIWGAIARLAIRPRVRDWLIRRALRTPYSPIFKDGEMYMNRFWLFNPYDLRPESEKGLLAKLMGKLPSVRLHHIRLPDRDRHPHSHPWRARTVILDGWYEEERLMDLRMPDDFTSTVTRTRRPGDTATLTFQDYHKITKLSIGGAWTLFITWKYQGTWGFLVDGKKVPYKKYLGL
jgi:hypothetical protein